VRRLVAAFLARGARPAKRGSGDARLKPGVSGKHSATVLLLV
jgi:hypothetical protein